MFRGAAGGGSRHHDAASCVSALTADDCTAQTSFSSLPSQQHPQKHQHPSPADLVPAAARRRRKKQKQTWKMQPIEVRAYVPLPQETGSVEHR